MLATRNVFSFCRHACEMLDIHPQKHHRSVQNLDKIFEMTMKRLHSLLNDVMRQETCFLLPCEVVPNSVAMDVLHFSRFIFTATTELTVTVMQLSPLMKKLFFCFSHSLLKPLCLHFTLILHHVMSCDSLLCDM